MSKETRVVGHSYTAVHHNVLEKQNMFNMDHIYVTNIQSIQKETSFVLYFTRFYSRQVMSEVSKPFADKDRLCSHKEFYITLLVKSHVICC